MRLASCSVTGRPRVPSEPSGPAARRIGADATAPSVPISNPSFPVGSPAAPPFPGRDHPRAGRRAAHPLKGLTSHDRGVDDHVPPRHRGARPLHAREELLDPEHRHPAAAALRRGADVRIAFLATCTTKQARTFLGPAGRGVPRLHRSRPGAVKAFGLEDAARAFVHVEPAPPGSRPSARAGIPEAWRCRGREPLRPHGLDRPGHPGQRRPVAVRRHSRRHG